MSKSYLVRTRARESQLEAATDYAKSIELDKAVATWANKSKDAMRRSELKRAAEAEARERELMEKDLVRQRRMRLQELYAQLHDQYAQELDDMGLAFAPGE